MTSVVTDKAKKVLVVDDDGAIVKLIDYVLKRQGYKPITATYWTDALDALTHGAPDLILLDLSMPTVDGCCLLEFIRDRDNRVPVIVVSGHIDGDTAEKLAGYGVEAFVWKPFRVGDLTDEVERVIGPGRAPDGTESSVPVREEVPAPSVVAPPEIALGPAPPEADPGDEGYVSIESIVALAESPLELPAADSSPPSNGTAPCDTGRRDAAHDLRHVRRRSTRRAVRRRTWITLGLVSLACVLLATFLGIASRVASDLDFAGLRIQAQQSIADQSLQNDEAAQKAESTKDR